MTQSRSPQAALRQLVGANLSRFKVDLSRLFDRHARYFRRPSPDQTKTGHGGFRRRRQPQHLDCHFSARPYRDSRNRHYRLFIPSRYQEKKPLPLVMVLHGCQQTHLDIASICDFDRLAEREGFIVVYPFVSSYSDLRGKNCWGWWLPGQIRAGAGEVEDLKHIIDEVKDRFAIDHHRVHVAGLSSGAGMAVALMVAHGQHISSGCSVAGVAYGETSHAVNMFRSIPPHFRPVPTLVRAMEKQMPEQKHPVPLLIVHSRDDDTVDIKAAKNLRDSWAGCHDISLLKKTRVKTGETGASRWRYTRYQGAGARHRIDTLWLEGPGHGWYGGNSGNFSYPNAVNISRHIWQFFKTHPSAT